MPKTGHFALLPGRGVLEIAGPDAVGFLNALISNDAAKAGAKRTIYAALLSAQGRYLHDFFIYAPGEAFLLDCEAERLADLQRRLSLYRLRANVTLSDQSPRWMAAAAFGDGALAQLGLGQNPGQTLALDGGMVCADPRLAALGARGLLPRDRAAGILAGAGLDEARPEAYDRWRLTLGVPEGGRDLEAEKSLPAESNLDLLQGVDFAKGCYVGQELTARMKHRALLKKRLLPVKIEGAPPPPGSEITLEGMAVGEMRSSREGVGLALLRIDAATRAMAEGGLLRAGEARLSPYRPDWLAQA